MSNATDVIIDVMLAYKLRGYVAQKKSTWCKRRNILKYIRRYIHMNKHIEDEYSE